MRKIISIDLQADFGFFRKPDTNSGINLSYNMLHKPALLGILGAIIGLGGYKTLGEVPEYYTKLSDLRVGIEPLNHEKGNFDKIAIKYSNTVGYANNRSNYLTEEATLIAPCYRCYILLDIENKQHLKLYDYLKAGNAEYIPYFGKNEFSAWWVDNEVSFKEYNFEEGMKSGCSIAINTIFEKLTDSISEQKVEPEFDIFNIENMVDTFIYFERLPKGFNLELNQYELGNFAFTNFKIKSTSNIKNIFYLTDEDYYVQLN